MPGTCLVHGWSPRIWTQGQIQIQNQIQIQSAFFGGIYKVGGPGVDVAVEGRRVEIGGHVPCNREAEVARKHSTAQVSVTPQEQPCHTEPYSPLMLHAWYLLQLFPRPQGKRNHEAVSEKL